MTRFLEMIGKLGPQPRLVNFFEAICSVGGVAVKANQEMILRLTWMDSNAREHYFLETKALDPMVNIQLDQIQLGDST